MEKQLLLNGGTHAVWPGQDHHLDALLSRGHLHGEPVELLGMALNLCHTNAAEVWARDIENTQLLYGYGLSQDGLWRQHGWCVKGGTLLETNVPMTRYFGITFGQQDAAKSWVSNFLGRQFGQLDEKAAAWANRHYPQVMALWRKYDKEERRRHRNSLSRRFDK